MRPGQKHWVYVMTNRYRNVLYIGVTNNLQRRMNEHQVSKGSLFSKKYNTQDLLYFEEFVSIVTAIKREKQLKKWKRK